MIAATGRLSSTGPNLQYSPVRTQEGRRIRECFIAGIGYESLLTAITGEMLKVLRRDR